MVTSAFPPAGRRRFVGRQAVFAALTIPAALVQAATFSFFHVDARLNSTAFSSLDATPLNTGLVLAAGDRFDITATGMWEGSGGCPLNDANGSSCFGNAPLTNINNFSLVGKIGSDASYDATWFKIGTNFSGIAAYGGTLFLAFLDSDSLNNSGVVTASVALVPEPVGRALLLIGAAALAWRHRRAAARGP
jgi:hypothetical protein